MVTPVKKKKTRAAKVESVVETELRTRVGIREIRQHASRVFDLVKNGESIVVTDRGEPIAIINPIKKDKLQRLIEEGAITPALRPFDPTLWVRTEGPFYPEALDEFLKERHESRY